MTISTADIFGADKALIGMVHVQALPGTPRASDDVIAVAQHAVDEARMLADCGCDALIIENMHDVPYLNRDVGPEIVAAMTGVGAAVRQAVEIPLGVQILAGANHAALAVAYAIGAQFIRTEGFVFASVADEGLMASADAGPLLRYRRAIGADSVRVLADIKKKHSAHAITADVSIADTARAAEFCGADGVIVTGSATGCPVSGEELRSVRNCANGPLIVGSGVTATAAAKLLSVADALIVGSAMKRDGLWSNSIDPIRARAIASAVRSVRTKLRFT